MASRLVSARHPGVIRGEGFESKCWVEVVTRLHDGFPPALARREIVSVEKPAQEGSYKLFVDGDVQDVRFSGGFWLGPMV